MARESDFISLSRVHAASLWDGINGLKNLQPQWNALDYGNTLPTDADGKTAAMVGAVVFDTANAFANLFSSGHATNLCKLLPTSFEPAKFTGAFTARARAYNKMLWEAIYLLKGPFQAEWNALDYGNTLDDGTGENAGITKTEVGAVVFATTDALVALLAAGHATNMAKLL